MDEMEKEKERERECNGKDRGMAQCHCSTNGNVFVVIHVERSHSHRFYLSDSWRVDLTRCARWNFFAFIVSYFVFLSSCIQHIKTIGATQWDEMRTTNERNKRNGMDKQSAAYNKNCNWAQETKCNGCSSCLQLNVNVCANVETLTMTTTTTYCSV